MKTTPVHQLETLTETDTQEHVYQKPARYVHELKWHLIEIWSATSRASLINRQISDEIVLLRVSKPKANTLNSFYDVFLYDDVIFMTFKANITAAVVNKLTYVSFHKVVWEQPSGEVVSFVAVLLQIY